MELVGRKLRGEEIDVAREGLRLKDANLRLQRGNLRLRLDISYMNMIGRLLIIRANVGIERNIKEYILAILAN